MRTELNKLHDRVGKTSVYVTHDQEEAMTLGDRIAVMNDGRLQQFDSPQRVYDEPTNRFVAGFIGEPPMNFFDAEFVERNGDQRLVSDPFELTVPENVGSKLARWEGDLERLVFGVRPENLHDASLLDTDETDAGATFRAHVKVVEPMGSNVDLTLAPDAESPEEEEFTARVSNDTTAVAGDDITLAVDVAETHVFDGQSGKNITI